MESLTLMRQLNKEIKILRRDISEIKGAIISTKGDAEGEYQRAFVQKITKRSQEKPIYRYTGRESFLRHVRAATK